MDTEKSDQMDMLREMAQVSRPVEAQEEWVKRVSTEEFKNTNKATRVWVSENKALREMHEIAVEDYVTSRHAVLDLGLLRTGLALAAQAIEKFLKCYLLASGLTIEDTRKYNHKIHSLLEKAHEISAQKELLNYSGFCKELEKWYNSRYPDSLNPASQWMRNAVPEFDKFVCYLEEYIPIPSVVTHLRYGGGEMGHDWSSIFVRLFDATSSQHRAALLNENIVLISRLGELEKKFSTNRLAAAMPATTLKESMEHSNKVQAVIRKYEKK
jgi:HEPN domain